MSNVAPWEVIFPQNLKFLLQYTWQYDMGTQKKYNWSLWFYKSNQRQNQICLGFPVFFWFLTNYYRFKTFLPDQIGLWFLVQPVGPVGLVQFLKQCRSPSFVPRTCTSSTDKEACSQIKQYLTPSIVQTLVINPMVNNHSLKIA